MIRLAALLIIPALINPILADSEPLQTNNINLAYETANQVELISGSPIASGSVLSIGEDARYTYITGYSSTPDQTDSSPFITASGSHVRPGVAASNWLPLGAKIQIPEIFGDRVFVIEDRMNARYTNRVDIWFPDRDSALLFGKNYTKVVIL